MSIFIFNSIFLKKYIIFSSLSLITVFNSHYFFCNLFSNFLLLRFFVLTLKCIFQLFFRVILLKFCLSPKCVYLFFYLRFFSLSNFSLNFSFLLTFFSLKIFSISIFFSPKTFIFLYIIFLSNTFYFFSISNVI